jgi:ubiquinone/menaquinone biosynthesis C-methylase UbiE
MSKKLEEYLRIARENHKDVPANYYEQSIRTNLGQRFWHNARFEQLKKMISPNKDAKVLDIGSADGTFTNVILENLKPKALWGIDVLESSVKYARRKFDNRSDVSFKVADAHNLPFSDSFFDWVFCLEVMEHVASPQKVISEIRRVLRKNGQAVILVPAENTLFKIIWWFWKKGKGKIWKESHLQDFGKTSLKDFFVKAGFDVTEERYFLMRMLYIAKFTKI